MGQNTSNSPLWLLLSDLHLCFVPGQHPSPSPLSTPGSPGAAPGWWEEKLPRQCCWPLWWITHNVMGMVQALRGQTPTVKGHQAECGALLCSASERHCCLPIVPKLLVAFSNIFCRNIFLLWLKKAVYCTLDTWMFVNKIRERKPEK